MNTKYSQPPGCVSCALHGQSIGFVPPVGPTGSPLLLLGAHAGYDEAASGLPMVGAAGGMLTRLLNALGWSREQLRIGNVLGCAPPGAEPPKKQAFISAATTCAQYRTGWLAPHPVIVAMGGHAIRTILNLWDLPSKYFSVDDFHGTVTTLPSGQRMVGTYHPSFLQRGAHRLFKVVCFDLQVASDVAAGKWAPEPIDPIIDPPVEWFRQYVEQFLAYARQNPEDAWLACDMETPDTRGKSEAELGEDDRSYQILRHNFACNRDQGVTVPDDGVGGRYRALAQRLIEEAPVTLWWNCPTPDQKVLTADLRWVSAGDLTVGDALVGFDEEPQPGRRTRRYKTSVVTHAERRMAEVYAVVLSDGRTVKVTGEHRWLAVKQTGENRRTFRWVKTTDLRQGQSLQPLFDVWEEGRDWTAGYLAGIFDGEGSLTTQKATGTMVLSFTQSAGPVLDQTFAQLDKIEARHGHNFPRRGKDTHVARAQVRGRTADMARVLGYTRPTRLLQRFRPELLGGLQTLRTMDLKVVTVLSLGRREIVGLSTSTRTYVLEGFGAHNCNFDLPRYAKAGIEPKLSHSRRMLLDGMWLCKHLQSDVPMGLGFWAPFYSKHGAWKHLADSAPGEYAAYDGPQTWRTVTGICDDLVEAGKWEIAHRHAVRTMERVLRPATEIGVQVNRERLDAFEAHLTTEARRLVHAMQDYIPDTLLPLTPKEGLVHRPPEGSIHAKGTDTTRKGEKRADADDMDPIKLELYAEFAGLVERQVRRTVWVCQLCKAEGVAKTHRCDKTQERNLQLEERTVTRWFWQEPFNPDSTQQWLAYMKAKGHQPGKNKKTRKDAADREALQRLARTTGDPIYQQGLDLRAVVKVRGTYAIGIRKRLDAANRFHPVFTQRPSTKRLSAVAPNITNVVADKGGKKGLAAGFRKCVVASTEPPPWWDTLTPEQQAEYL